MPLPRLGALKGAPFWAAPLLAALIVFGLVGRAAAGERIVAIPVAGGTLEGTLAVPDGLAGRLAPAVLLLGDSGPRDRDGNTPTLKSDTLGMLARSLAAKGVASLRFDKRGVGASKDALSREEDVRVDTFVADGAAALGLLRQQAEIGPLFLVGYGEGGIIATLLAERVAVSGLVLIAAPGRPIGALIRQQLARTDTPKAVQTAAFAALTRLEQGQAVGAVPQELSALMRPSLQPYLISLLAIDPAVELGRVSAPTLVMQGTTDLQVDMSDANRLVEARRTIRLNRLDGVNHALKLAPMDDRDVNLRTYNDPAIAIAPAVATGIQEFIRATIR